MRCFWPKAVEFFYWSKECIIALEFKAFSNLFEDLWHFIETNGIHLRQGQWRGVGILKSVTLCFFPNSCGIFLIKMCFLVVIAVKFFSNKKKIKKYLVVWVFRDLCKMIINPPTNSARLLLKTAFFLIIEFGYKWLRQSLNLTHHQRGFKAERFQDKSTNKDKCL